MELDAEKLIVLVQERPPIYDYTSKEHHNRDIMDKLWQEIGVDMGAPGEFGNFVFF